MKTLKQLREEYDSQFLDSVDFLPEEVMLEAVKKTSLMSNTPSFKQMPSLLVFRRITYRKYPNDQVVALYYSSLVDKYLSIPFGPTGNLNLSEAVIHDSDELNEDLRKWFKEKWVRYDTKGKIKGPCAREEGEGKPKCRPLASARSMSKEERAKSARRKRREDPVADRPGKGGKPVMVRTEETLLEKNVPTNPALWARAKAQARAKFDVYPSAYANGWASKWYKSKGGGWKSSTNESIEEACWDGYKSEGMKKKGNRMVPNCVPVKEGWASIGHAYDFGGDVNRKAKFYGDKPKPTDTKKDEKDDTYKDSKQGGKVKFAKTVKEDWQDVNRKDKTDGLSQAAVNAYRRENPGSKLKTAVTTKPSKLKKGSKAANRRKSFCSRMGGMKKRLTSAKTARDPNSRINKALRRWNCEESFNMRLHELRQRRNQELNEFAPAALGAITTAARGLASKQGLKRLAKGGLNIAKNILSKSSDSETQKKQESEPQIYSTEFGKTRSAKGKSVSLVPTSSLSDPVNVTRDASLERKYREKSIQSSKMNENKMSDIRKMVREGIEYKDLDINGRTVTLNTSMAKRILEVYDSVNTKNKKIVEGMLNEDMESFKKLLNFSIKA